MEDKSIWGEGIPELQNGSVELDTLSDYVTVPRKRYDELIRQEESLKALTRLTTDVSIMSLPANTMQSIIKLAIGEWYYKCGKLEFNAGKELSEQ